MKEHMRLCSNSHKDSKSIKAAVWQFIQGVKQSVLVGGGKKEQSPLIFGHSL